MTNMKKQTFNEFCQYNCDGMYSPKFPDKKQCTGYLQLKKMVKENIIPFSLEEIKRWEENPTDEELSSIPDIRTLKFLHVLLRPYIINRWDYIKTLEL